jgi:hypothetical protein
MRALPVLTRVATPQNCVAAYPEHLAHPPALGDRKAGGEGRQDDRPFRVDQIMRHLRQRFTGRVLVAKGDNHQLDRVP